MTRYSKAILAIALCCPFIIGASCGDQNAGNKNAAKKEVKKADSKRDPATLPNYRYVDADSVLAKYNLSKDYQEEMLRLQSSIENTQKQRASAIQALANQIQQKAQNNGYTEATYNADMAKLNQMQNAAEEEIGKMQMNAQSQMVKAQEEVNDSILNFIKRYNESFHYDAIFMKAATLYIDPALDITDEVIDGLNSNYNKK
jgi:outer membrane protein